MKTLLTPHLGRGILLMAALLFGATPLARGDSSILTVWPGMTNRDRTVPPDPHGASGPQGVVATVNLSIAYFNKAGAAIWGPTNFADGFFTSANNGNTGAGNADPKVIFDPSDGRFYVILQENTASQSFLNVAASKNSHPVSNTTADWFFYRINMTETANGNAFGGDYPGLAVDGQGVYVTYNMFQLPIAAGMGNFLRSQILALRKNELNNGTVVVFRYDANTSTLQPVTPRAGPAPNNTVYFLEMLPEAGVGLWALQNPFGPGTLSNVILPTPGNNGGVVGTGAPQSGSTNRVDLLSDRTQGNAFFSNGDIWACHTFDDFNDATAVYYCRVRANNYPTFPSVPFVVEYGAVGGGNGTWAYQPSISGNSRGDVCLVFSQSSANTFPGIWYAARPSSAVAFDPPQLLKAGPAPLNCNVPVCRWGDFATVAEDPVDGSFWVSHETAKTSAQNDWMTWWGHIQISPPLNLFTNDFYVDKSIVCPLPQAGQESCNPFKGGPYLTVGFGVSHTPPANVLHIRSANYNEANVTINKLLQLRAESGPVTIGRP